LQGIGKTGKPFDAIQMHYEICRGRAVTITLATTLRRDSDILHAAVGTEELVMLSISAGRYYGLNSVGARFWELLEAPTTVAQICARLCEEFEVDEQDCQTALLKFANDLVDYGVVHVA
jgi:hypothetical protein